MAVVLLTSTHCSILVGGVSSETHLDIYIHTHTHTVPTVSMTTGEADMLS